MNFNGLREYQVLHAQTVIKALRGYRAALDASDTGTGKTYVALWVCRELGIVPLVIGPKGTRGGWGQASEVMNAPIEFVNYERARGMPKKENGGYCHSNWGKEIPYGSGSMWKWHNNYSMIIFDECHRCGGLKTLNSKMMIAAKRQSHYTLALSATAAESPLQMKAVGYLLGLHNNTKFRDWCLLHGCHPGWTGWVEFTENQEKQKAAMEKIHRSIFPSRGARMVKGLIEGFPKTQIDVLYLDDEENQSEEIAERIAVTSKRGVGEGIEDRQALEMMMVPYVDNLVGDYVKTSKIVVFTNYIKTLDELVDLFGTRFGNDRVGYVDGRQVGEAGDKERQDFVDRFQADELDVIVVNSQAGGAGLNLHGKTDRTTFILPLYSGKAAKQVVGRVQRDGGGFSQQFFLYFGNSFHKKIGLTLKKKFQNIDSLNDGDLTGSEFVN